MATSKDSGASGEKAKRVKTGGRPAKKSLDEMIVDAERRNRLAKLDDDTTVEAELAAFYLIISPSQLRELRKTELPSEEDKKAAKAAKASGSKEEPPKRKGLRMIKLVDKEAVGLNQKVTYKMGDLRRFQDDHSGYDTFETTLAAGILGWVSDQRPFFCKPAPSRRGTPRVVAKGWGLRSDLDAREKLVKQVFDGELELHWVTAAEAARWTWDDPAEHKKLAKAFTASLKFEAMSVEMAVQASVIAAETAMPKPAAAAGKPVAKGGKRV